MNRPTAWLGLTHFRKVAETAQLEYKCAAAVWANDRKEFEEQLKAHLENIDATLLWVEEVHHATQWMHKFSREKATIALASKVHPHHRVELGQAVSIDKKQPQQVAVAPSTNTLIIEEIKGLQPLDQQFGVHPSKTVPDLIYQPLFGQPQPTKQEIKHYGGAENLPPMNTYAIFDAAKIMHFDGADTHFTDGLECKCLFQGNAAEELKSAAPYIVALESNHDFTKTLFSYLPNWSENHSTMHLWHKEAAIYIRSRASLDDVRKHFRKFTQIQDNNGKWFLFRFYDPKVVSRLLNGTKKGANIASCLLSPSGQPAMQLIVCTREKSITVAFDPAIEMTQHPLSGQQVLEFFNDNSFDKLLDEFFVWTSKMSDKPDYDEKIIRPLLENDLPLYKDKYGMPSAYALNYCLLSSLVTKQSVTDLPKELIRPLQDLTKSPEQRSENYLKSILRYTNGGEYDA